MADNGSAQSAADRTEQVRLAVYTRFASDGRAPRPAELATDVGRTPAEVRQEFRRLHASRDVVLDPHDGDRILMAHPFSAIPLGFSVMGARTLWWGGCAWDSFAIPHLVPAEPEVLVATACPGCGAALAWTVGRAAPPAGEGVAHFRTPVADAWPDVVRTCANQRLFCSTGCVAALVARDGGTRGYVMDLATLWRLARGWYAGRLDRGYVRREPASAAAYFADAGLRGPFWGLPTDGGA
ncbi:alkylmercury lyase-like protein [Murinocardiopsis flavida]|uniref:Alkylmercury lyase-like protein n=1 Tax=Murinocardiopsis flavida TaxID=645275 RepID=A0A2P8DKF9_9ACTN|nr:organomercurial lyase [Murinocardiopsis flavida]PSK97710.1 alkylmercury lyase-like protein [Murinocardiopsis flavida]